jgi:hypothetical protein
MWGIPARFPIVVERGGTEFHGMTSGDGGKGREGPVERALGRWVGMGLLDPATGARLLEDARRVRAERRQRFAQAFVAGTAGTVTVIAAGVFFGWAWPHLGPGGRSAALGITGGLLALLGLRVEQRPGRGPAGYALQSAGLLLVLVAFAYSEGAWGNGSPGALLVGGIALAVPLLMAPMAVRRNRVMPAVLTVLGYGFLFVFLVRVADLGADLSLWVLNGVLLASLLVLGLRVRRWWARTSRTDQVPGEDDLPPDGPGWELGAFTASIHAAPILILATAVGPMRMGDESVIALDVWWVIMTGLTLWAIHRAPVPIRRPWVPRQLAWSVFSGVVLGFWTVLGALDGPPWAAALVVAALGAATLWHALTQGIRETIAHGCLALIAAAWYFGAESAGAPGAAAALGFTALLLFWISGRLGRWPEAGAGAESSG